MLYSRIKGNMRIKEKMKIKKNKKGSVLDVVIWVIIAFVVVLFLGLWMYGHGLITNALLDSPSEVVVNATQDIVVPVNNALGTWLKVIAFIILFGGAVSIMISNFLIKGHPVFFIVYVFMTVVAIIVSASISNRYMELLSHVDVGSTLQQFTAVNFIMQWLPYWAAVIGIFGAIFLFIGIIRGKQEGIPV